MFLWLRNGMGVRHFKIKLFFFSAGSGNQGWRLEEGGPNGVDSEKKTIEEENLQIPVFAEDVIE